jgi:hypothetical protein
MLVVADALAPATRDTHGYVYWHQFGLRLAQQTPKRCQQTTKKQQ